MNQVPKRSLRDILAERNKPTNTTNLVENSDFNAIKKVFDSKAWVKTDDSQSIAPVKPAPLTTNNPINNAIKNQSSNNQKQSLQSMLLTKQTNQEATTITTIHPTNQATSGTVVRTYPNAKQVSNVAVKAKLSLAEMLKQKSKSLSPEIVAEVEKVIELTEELIEPNTIANESFSLDIILNEKQQAAVDMAKQGKNFVLMGSAGSGKTSSEREICREILKSPYIRTSSFANGDTRLDAPSLAVVAYTRRASANSAKAILKDPYLANEMPCNIMTVHALLEFKPEFYTEDGKEKFRFIPTRHKKNPLTLTHVIIEEATLLGLDLWALLYDALPKNCQIILVGDINQLQPVFGASIMNYGIKLLPSIELTQIYRQAEGSPIIDAAQAILKGESIQQQTNVNGSITIKVGNSPTEVGQGRMGRALSVMFTALYENNQYNPEEDMILCPYNKQPLGTTEMNYNIAEAIAIKENRIVHELIVGFRKQYLAVGDKVMFNKRDAIVTEIKTNPSYIGAIPKLASTDLSYHGFYRSGTGTIPDLEDEEFNANDIDYSNYSIDIEDLDGDRKMQSSHAVSIVYEEGVVETLTGVGDLSFPAFQLGYALTCHKAQGSEWGKVFIILHKDQLRSLNREWLYTAVTRASREVVIIGKEYLLDKVIKQQAIKGNDLQAKIDYFNNGMKMDDSITFDFSLTGEY